MGENVIENYLSDAIASFRSYKKLAEKALEQVPDEEFFWSLDSESNSVAIIVKHIAGNQRSRWKDFLTTDGEKPDRNRDMEFELFDETREFIMAGWESGWTTLFSALENLSPGDFSKTITIRGEPHTVVEAINRQLTHYAYHIGQITFLAKHFRTKEWKTLSVPRNKSQEFNEFLEKRMAGGKPKKHPIDGPADFAEEE